MQSKWRLAILSTINSMHQGWLTKVIPTILDPWLCLSWPTSSFTQRTWWPPATHATAGISPWPTSSEAACPWKRSTSSCWPSRIRTAHTLWSGSPTTLKQPCAIYRPEAWKWPLHLSEIPLRSKSFSKGLVAHSQPCSGGKPSCTGTQVLDEFNHATWKVCNSLLG